jgi:hypothetical protein
MFRPVAGRQRLIDVQRAEELPLTELYALIGGSPSPEIEDGRAIVDTLSRTDQFALWEAADRLLQARRDVDEGGPVVSVGAAGAGPALDLRPKRGLLRRRPRNTPAAPTDRRGVLDDAERAWSAIAGGVPVDVAMRLKERCEAAARLAVRVGALATVSRRDDGLVPPPDREALLDAVEQLVPLRGGDGGPHIVAVPGSADPELASLLLDSLVLINERQLIVVTADQQVIDWAKLEHHANRAALVPCGPDGH